MKRLLLRMTLLSLVVGLGTVAVYEAQRQLHPPEPAPSEFPDAMASLDAQPIPLVAAEPGGRRSDPYGYAAAAPIAVGRRLPLLAGQRWASVRTIINRSIKPTGAAGRSPTSGLCTRLRRAVAALCPAGQFAPPARCRAGPIRRVSRSPATRSAPASVRPHALGPFAASGMPDETTPLDAQTDDWQDHFAPPSSAAQGNYRSRRSAGAMPPAASDSVGRGDDTPSTGRGVGRPGERELEGAQAPSLTIEKRAPSEIQVGKVAKFTTTVRNQGQVAAQGVEVHDLVPQGTELVGTTPQAEVGPQGELVWQLGTLKPGGEASVQMQLMPLAEGEIGSVATLHFQTGASVRTVATRPQVAIEVTAPPRVMIGTEVTLRIKISNPGSGTATGIVVTEAVPPNLTHPGGSELEFEIGTLKPGESRELELALKAVARRAGRRTCWPPAAMPTCRPKAKRSSKWWRLS